MDNVIYERVLVKCSQWGIDPNFAPVIYKLALMKNKGLQKAAELIESGEIEA